MALIANPINSSSTVFFLGAGASALAGIPTFSNFYDEAKNICLTISKDDPDKELFKKILEHWKNDCKGDNIEQYYAAIEMSEILRDEHEIINPKDVEKFICSTIQKSLKRHDLFEFTYKQFLSIIEEEMHATVITTNWDIVLESSQNIFFKDIWEDVNYGGVLPCWTSPDKKNLTEGETNSDELPHMGYYILKLHGSLNWGFCENCGQIYYFEKKMYDPLTLDEVPCCSKECQEKHSKLKAVIVPPTLSKLAKAQPQLVTIWNKARESLKSCERIFFIGYSFPQTDEQMRVFISNALRKNSNLKEVIIVSNRKHGNAKVDFEERYLSILSRLKISPSDINFYYEGFEGFCIEWFKKWTKKQNPYRI